MNKHFKCERVGIECQISALYSARYWNWRRFKTGKVRFSIDTRLISAESRNIYKRHFTHICSVFVETVLDELFEGLGEVSLQDWRRLFGYEEENPHWVQLGEGWLPLCQLNCRNPQWPNVRLETIETHENKLIIKPKVILALQYDILFTKIIQK